MAAVRNNAHVQATGGRVGKKLLLVSGPPVILLLISIGAHMFNLWGLVTFGNSTAEPYQDLRQVTASSECLIQDPDRNIFAQTCDPYERPYNYPVIWAKGLAFAGVTSAWTEPLGIAFSLLLSMAFWVIGWTLISDGTRGFAYSIYFAAVVSPPVFLLLQRGNIDALVLVLLVASAVYISKERPSFAGIGLGLATALKFFPMPGSLALLGLKTGKLRAISLFTIVTVIGVGISIPDLAAIAAGTPQPMTAGFGAAVLFMPFWNIFTLPLPDLAPRLAGLATVSLVAAVSAFLLHRNRHRTLVMSLNSLTGSLARSPSSAAFFSVGVGSFVGAYILGTNFDYRLTVIALGVAALTLPQPVWNTRLAPALGLILTGILWVSYPMPVRIQQVVELVLLALVPLLLILLMRLAQTQKVRL